MWLFCGAMLKIMSVSIDALEDNIKAFINDLPAESLERVCQNVIKLIDHLWYSLGQRLNNLQT